MLSNTKPHFTHIFDILISCFGFEKNNNIVYITLSLLCCSTCEFINTVLLWLRLLCLLTFIVSSVFISSAMATHFLLVDLVSLHHPPPLSMASSRSCNTQQLHQSHNIYALHCCSTQFTKCTIDLSSTNFTASF